MLEAELKRLLEGKRGMPHPSRGCPFFFYGLGSLSKGADYHNDGRKRYLTPLHPQVIFQYTFSGYGSFKRGRKTFRVDEGKGFFAIVPSSHVYELPSHSPGWSYFYLVFQHPYIAERITRALKLHSGVVSVDEKHPLIVKSAELIRLKQTGMFRDRLDEESHLFDWMCCALGNLSRVDHARKEADEWKTRLAALMEQDTSSLPTIKELASYFGLTRAHFTRVFKQKSGISPAAFLRQVRLHHVEQDLRLTSKTLKEIATDYGYGDISRLCKAFANCYGLTPAKYRGQ